LEPKYYLVSPLGLSKGTFKEYRMNGEFFTDSWIVDNNIDHIKDNMIQRAKDDVDRKAKKENSKKTTTTKYTKNVRQTASTASELVNKIIEKQEGKSTLASRALGANRTTAKNDEAVDPTASSTTVNEQAEEAASDASVIVEIHKQLL